jgi:hypothetical protein
VRQAGVTADVGKIQQPERVGGQQVEQVRQPAVSYNHRAVL